MLTDHSKKNRAIGGALFVTGLIIGFLATIAVLNSRSSDQVFNCSLSICEGLTELSAFASKATLLMLPWPFVVLIIFFSLGSTQIATFVRQLVRRVKKVKFAGNEMELSAEDKVEIEMDSRRFKSEVQAYRDLVLIEMSRYVKEKDIRKSLGDIIPAKVAKDMDECPISTLGNWRKSHRITIHVPDFVFADRLVQLVDYVGNGRSGTAGRTFSMRQGIIGKVWRGREAILQNDLLNGADASKEIPYALIVRIVQEWGMTEEEAYRAIDYRSYFAMPIFERLSESAKAQGVVPKLMGILYLDSESPNQFEGKASQDPADLKKNFESWLNRRLDALQIRDAIADITIRMKSFHPGITLAS